MALSKKLLESLLSLSALQASNHILNLIIVPYLVRTLSAEHFGALSFSQSFAQYFFILTDYGFQLSATRTATSIRQNPKALSQLFCTVMVIKAGLLCISSAIFLLLLLVVPFFRSHWVLHSVVFMSVVGNALFPTWLYQGVERMRYPALVGVAFRILSVVMTFLLIHTPDDYLLAAGIQSASVLISGIVALLLVPVALNLKPEKPSYALSAKLILEGRDVFASSVAVSLYTNSNVFVVGLMTNPVEVGLFSASEKLVRAVLNLMSPVAQAVYPHVNSLARLSRLKALAFLAGMVKIYGSIALLISLLLFFSSDWIVIGVFGTEFASAAVLLRWMSFLPFVIAISNILGIQTMLTFGFHREYSLILIAAGLLNMALLFPMTILWHGTGAAISNLLTETAVSLVMFFFVLKRGYHLFPPAGAQS
jgi:polysaccharide transporter, PST family